MKAFPAGRKNATKSFKCSCWIPFTPFWTGLDIDALRIVSEGVNSMRSPFRSFLVITHYKRLLDYIKPDVVHVLAGGRIVRTGGGELVGELESRGYEFLKETEGVANA